MHSSLLSITVALSYLLVFREVEHWLQEFSEEVPRLSCGRIYLNVISVVDKLYIIFDQ
jgi:hypothetical protein